MKWTINGFSQSAALEMVRIEERRGKMETVRIDATDLLILRWFVDFYPNMKKRIIDGREYAWLKHSKIVEDMPLLAITPKSCVARMKKLVSFGVLDYKIIKHEGTFSYYAFGPTYKLLVDDSRSNGYGVAVQTDIKDSSTMDSSTMDSSTMDSSTMDSSTMIHSSCSDARASSQEGESALARKPKKPVKHRHGMYENVMLTDAELSKLKTEFPGDWQARIDRLSEYMESTGKTYKNHLATVRAWARKDAAPPKAPAQPGFIQHEPGAYDRVETDPRYMPGGIFEGSWC